MPGKALPSTVRISKDGTSILRKPAATKRLIISILRVVGTVSGGPMYYIEKGLGPKWKWMAVFFATALGVTAFLTGNAIQANTVADTIGTAFGTAQWITGLVTVTICNESGKPLKEFGESKPITGNVLDETVRWSSTISEPMRGESIRLKFTIQNADLFSYWWR